MRRFGLVLILACGCGRLGFDGVGDDPAGGGGIIVPPQSAARLHPVVCGTNTITVGATDPDIALAGTPTGAAVFWVPKAGGNLFGMTLDMQLQQVAPPTTVRAGMFTAAGANYVDDTLIASTVSSSRAIVQIVPSDLSSYTEIANLDGMYASEESVVHANAARITPTACSAGLMVNPYTGWTSDGTQLSVTTSQTTGLDSTPYGAEALSMWSTADGCNLVRHTSRNQGVSTQSPTPCMAPRLASDGTNGIAMYENGMTIDQMLLAPDAFGAIAPFASGSSPRVLFDGTLYWVAYLDMTGTLVVGYLDAQGGFSSVTLGDAAPQHDAFELAYIDGKIWDVSMTDTTAIAHQICLATN